MDSSTEYRIIKKIVNSNEEALRQQVEELINVSENDFYDDLPQKL